MKPGDTRVSFHLPRRTRNLNQTTPTLTPSNEELSPTLDPNDLPGVGETESQKDQILLKFKISTLSYIEKAFLIQSKFLPF